MDNTKIEVRKTMMRKVRIYNPNASYEYMEGLSLLHLYRDMHPIDRDSMYVQISKHFTEAEKEEVNPSIDYDIME